MSEYRDDLAAAHRRIAQLEETLGLRTVVRAPRRSRGPLFPWLIGFGGATACVGGAAVLLAIGSRSAEAVTTEVVAREPRLHASWYTQPAVLPAMVDVDGDGTKDYVGLFWRTGQDETPLYAAAIDGNTFRVKWSAGPFRSQWNSTRTHLTVVGDKVLVSDTQESLRVLQLATGRELANVRVPDGVVEMCPLGDGTSRAVVRTSTAVVADRTRIFDVASATLTTEASAACPSRYDRCSTVGGGPPCFHHGAIPKAPPEATTSPSFYVSRTLQEGGSAIAIGTDARLEGRDAPQAVAFLPGAAAPLWKASLLAPGDELHFGGVQTELRSGRLVAFYQSRSGPFRLVSRDAHTGLVAWATAIPGSQEGSYAAAFGTEGDRVLVVMNQTVHVFDAATGTHLAALDAASL